MKEPGSSTGTIHINTQKVIDYFSKCLVDENNCLKLKISPSLFFKTQIIVCGIEINESFVFVSIIDRNDLNPFKLFESFRLTHSKDAELFELVASEILENSEKLMVESCTTNSSVIEMALMGHESVEACSNYEAKIGRDPWFCFLPFTLLANFPEFVINLIKESEDFADPFIGYPLIENRYLEDLGLPLRSCPRFSEYGIANVDGYEIEDLFLEEIGLRGLRLTSKDNLEEIGLSVGQNISVSFKNRSGHYSDIKCRVVDVRKNKVMARSLAIPLELEEKLIRRENRVSRYIFEL